MYAHPILKDAFKGLLAKQDSFELTLDMQCILALIYLTDRTNYRNKKRFEGLSDEQVLRLIKEDITKESDQFKRIKKETSDEYLRCSAINNLKFNTRIQRLMNQYFGHN